MPSLAHSSALNNILSFFKTAYETVKIILLSHDQHDSCGKCRISGMLLILNDAHFM